MSPVVMDASVVLSWCFGDKSLSYAETVIRQTAREGFLTPQHWALEVSNGLVMAERRGRINGAERQRVLAILRALPVDADPHTPSHALRDIPALAYQYGLTAYDAAYLELASRAGLPLATLDKALRAAALLAGVKVI